MPWATLERAEEVRAELSAQHTEIRDSTPPRERRARRGLRGHAPGTQGAAGPGILPKNRSSSTSRVIPNSYSRANLAAGKKTTLPSDGKCQGCRARAVLLLQSPAGILGKHGRSSTGSGFVAIGAGISAGIHSQFPAHAL